MIAIRRRRALVSSVLAVAFLGAACGGAQTGGEAADPNRLMPDNLYPLGEGFVWSFETNDGEETVLSVTQVISQVAERFELTTGGEPFVYERRPDGIFRPAYDSYLLKAPIREGAEWPGPNGRTARVTSVTERIEVPAGQFEGCVRIEESGSEDGKEIKTVYCPGVGPVFLETSMELTVSEAAPRVVSRLRGCNLLERNDGVHCFALE